MVKFNKTHKILMGIVSLYLLVIATYITISITMRSLPKVQNDNLGKSTVVMNENNENTTENTVIILNMKFSSSEGTVSKEIKAGDKYKDMTEKEIQEKFDKLGFTMDEFSKDKIVFKKESFYLPDKYIIGIKDNKICIYKSDEYGNLIIENPDDIFNMDASKLPEKERASLTKGHINYQFNTKDEAAKAVQEYKEFFR